MLNCVCLSVMAPSRLRFQPFSVFLPNSPEPRARWIMQAHHPKALIIHSVLGLPQQMSHATLCVNSGVSLKSRDDSEALGNVWLTTVKPQMLLRVLFSLTGKMASCFNKLTKAGVSERLHNPVYSFISTRRPTRTEIFPRELKLWQSHRFQLWQRRCHHTAKTVNALLKLAERLQKQPFNETSGQDQDPNTGPTQPSQPPLRSNIRSLFPAEQQQELCCPGDPLLHSLFHVWCILLREDVFYCFICFCVHPCFSGIIKIKWTFEPRRPESFLCKKYFHRCQFPCRFHLFIGHFLCKQVSISMKRRRSLSRLLPEMLSCFWQRSRGFQRLSVVTFQARLIGRAEVGILKDGEI